MVKKVFLYKTQIKQMKINLTQRCVGCFVCNIFTYLILLIYQAQKSRFFRIKIFIKFAEFIKFTLAYIMTHDALAQISLKHTFACKEGIFSVRFFITTTKIIVFRNIHPRTFIIVFLTFRMYSIFCRLVVKQKSVCCRQKCHSVK